MLVLLRLLLAVEKSLRLPESLARLSRGSHGFRPCGALALGLLRLLLRHLGLRLQGLLRLLLRLRRDNRFWKGSIFPGPALSTRSGVYESFGGSIVRRRCGRRGDDVAEDAVKVG